MASEPKRLGAVKLQKILWYFDVRSFQFTGETVTGASYIKKEHGPFTHQLKSAVNSLKGRGLLHTDVDDDFYGYEKAVFIGKGNADMSAFSDREIRWLEEITEDICQSHSAASISEKSHGPIWRMAELDELIPFGATVVRFIRPTVSDIAWAEKELGID
jgi:hypothetical protein